MINEEFKERLERLENELTALRDSTTVGLEDRVQRAQAALDAITTLVESTKAAAAAATESQRLATSALTETQAKQAEVAAVSTQAVATRTQIADQQAVIATKSDHIQQAQEHADKVRAELDRTLTAAQQEATATEGHKESAQSAGDTATKVLAEIRSLKGAAESETTAAAAARRQGEEAATIAKSLAEKAATIETRVADYEKKLAELHRESAAHLKTILTHLPGATAAGLASAFDKRRQGFLKPTTQWQWLFIGALVLIVLLTGTALWHVLQAGTAPTYDELVRMWLARLPVMIALVWLALHASHEAALAKRLEEDYGYKAAIATCFEGFKKQMAEVGTNVPAESPLARLLENTLRTIAAPPGRIYDKHALSATPAEEAKQAAQLVADALNKPKPT